MEAFIYENILFKETENDKIVCGVCEVECSRLIVHMNGNKYCTEYFSDMTDFKKKYSEYRDKRSRGKSTRKRKLESELTKNTPDSTAIPKKEEDQVPVSLQKAAVKDGKESSFMFGGYYFEELENGKIRCGICQAEC